ncbi:energy-coupled thiamine transporter ThiT [Paraclostridium bifermentans]|uniref:ECF-type riboflavin transporter, S component family protein n=1 Tax=Paraclostridium bifermentans ATCC 638 = DSM 14991 TaxID=1233171 RepID=T4VM49_PARBF|nr:energy-coupled thiamine transporter ThiT [Paraclostridium bifermentans]EQK42190.1 ECF-type riboflavin transporter, S component family protein [[Clostridium] bifermentans ATCC 638] [Paraclostridium bifermentans ATCC 638 = DSM 14991]MBS5952224.1 energy-coupled thiamine transporter ThiT [Paraclostridium bifermentans]MBU5287618.1 energy-coupled thiamine transporter ThiT [Paraclostridium bifermentans]MDU3335313.1 energy-coupled thiamine transporter ThiT [Paraclostridium bifermentans]RIZ57938.1 e
MSSVVIIIISLVLLFMYAKDINKKKFSTKEIVMIAMFSAISFILYMIQFIRYPQGGGITLFSMLPTMLLAILYGKEAGLTGGLIFGLLKLLNGAYVVHPAQFLLDYILSNMALGLAGEFGREKKSDMFKGCLFASSLSVLISIISGVVYFGQYAPEGMNIVLYSCIYNISSAGVEGLLSSIILVLLPIKRFQKVLKLSTN